MNTLTQSEATHGSQAMDRALQRRIATFLFERGPMSLRHLRTEVHGGVALIKGRVHSYYEKQLATSCCQRVPGVLRVINDVRVSDDTLVVPRSSDPIQTKGARP